MISFINHINEITKDDWQLVNKSNTPFLSYDFFQALENSDSATTKQGWQPHHLLFKNNDQLQTVLPLYLKQHSWGEYVFDWAWADAYQRNGLDYYPKLVSTIPFTPIPANKLLTHQSLSKEQYSTILSTEIFPALIEHCLTQQINSWHLLFCSELISCPLIEYLLDEPSNEIYQRHTVQFHWFNRAYTHFDDFLATFTSRKRKNTRKERLSIQTQQLDIRRLTGKEITEKELDYFYLAYQLTYLKRNHTPHLTKDFFQQIFNTMANNLLLVIASHNNNDVACALFFFDETNLYGRYWGCTESFNNLHFELCYYQGIEFCIENKLQHFNPGTQGEHKIQRGFEPILTHSYHWIKDQQFKKPIKEFCQQERQQMQLYQQQCQQLLPFKHQ